MGLGFYKGIKGGGTDGSCLEAERFMITWSV